jgi:hypothetical protein
MNYFLFSFLFHPLPPYMAFLLSLVQFFFLALRLAAVLPIEVHSRRGGCVSIACSGTGNPPAALLVSRPWPTRKRVPTTLRNFRYQTGGPRKTTTLPFLLPRSILHLCLNSIPPQTTIVPSGNISLLLIDEFAPSNAFVRAGTV